MLSLVTRVLRPRRIAGDPLLRRFASSDKWGVTNDRIRARVVNIAGDGGSMRLDVPIREALQEAKSQGVDLVQVSPVGKLPAVCRLFDAKKRLYELKKANKKASKQQKAKPDKEVVVGAKIAPNDLNMKVEQLKRFLNKGHKVKMTVKFDHAYHLKNQCLEQLERIGSLVDAETGAPSGLPKEQFGAVYVYFSPAN
ncbi:Translation initiation factor IF-3 [Phytophthora megakarya]|uniref:Translation initiation factor IF-3 n=1 Tax=Phytophthora megakarya TaxID=4795 RepID=A0A225WVB9_9STRA|nr:Translation initiation factor IF-3 [Phytophthora megakarya]